MTVPKQSGRLADEDRTEEELAAVPAAPPQSSQVHCEVLGSQPSHAAGFAQRHAVCSEKLPL